MIILRPIRESDQQHFIDLAHMSHIGLTSLPKDTLILKNKIHASTASFKKSVSAPQNEKYIFVLEDTEAKKIIGMSAIISSTDSTEPLYYYKKEILTVDSHLDQIVKQVPILSPVSYNHGPSEMCSLYLHPHYRKTGLGKLLSLGRFLFIAAFKERFTSTLFASLRGVIEDDTSLFWDAIGRKFFNASFTDIMEMVKYGKSFIPHFLPKYPIYVSLLPQDVQNVIGGTHEKSRAAQSILLREGFHVSDEIDIFDGGPILHAAQDTVRTIKHAKKYQVTQIVQNVMQGTNYLISNERIDFRAVLGHLLIQDDKYAHITDEASEALGIGLGDTIQAAEL